MSKATCIFTARIDAHFAGKNSVAEEAEMRRHLLDGCKSCNFRYTRQAMLAKVDPDARTPMDRLARGLGLGGRPLRRNPFIFLLLAAAAVAGAFLVVPGRLGDRGFQARGPGETTAAAARVFRLSPGAASQPVGDGFAAGDDLSFAYRNPTGKRHLYIFGVDEHRHVFWFSPAWRTAEEQPPSPVAIGDGAFHEIEDAVGHRYDGARLDIYGLFTDRPWRVQELEAVVAQAPAGTAPTFDGITVVHPLRISP